MKAKKGWKCPVRLLNSTSMQHRLSDNGSWIRAGDTPYLSDFKTSVSSITPETSWKFIALLYLAVIIMGLNLILASVVYEGF